MKHLGWLCRDNTLNVASALLRSCQRSPEICSPGGKAYLIKCNRCLTLAGFQRGSSTRTL